MAQTLEMLKAKIDLGHSDRKQCDGSTCASPTPEDEENDADSEETKKGITECKGNVFCLWKSLVKNNSILTITAVL